MMFIYIQASKIVIQMDINKVGQHWKELSLFDCCLEVLLTGLYFCS